MFVKIKDLLTPEELKNISVYNIDVFDIEKKVKDLTVQELSFMFMILEDFKNIGTGYIISCKVLEILINRAINKELTIF